MIQDSFKEQQRQNSTHPRFDRPRLHTTFPLLTDFDLFFNSKLPLIVIKMQHTLTRWTWKRLIGNKTAKTDAFQGRLNLRSDPRTKLVAKTPIPQLLACVPLCWPPMTVCWHNVDTLRRCKRSNRDFSS